MTSSNIHRPQLWRCFRRRRVRPCSQCNVSISGKRVTTLRCQELTIASAGSLPTSRFAVRSTKLFCGKCEDRLLLYAAVFEASNVPKHLQLRHTFKSLTTAIDSGPAPGTSVSEAVVIKGLTANVSSLTLFPGVIA